MKPTQEDFKKLSSQLGKAIHIDDLSPDEEGLLILEVDGEQKLHLQFLEHISKILIFTELGTLAEDASKEVYQDLLAANLFGSNTAGGFFAFEPTNRSVVYQLIMDYDDGFAAQDLTLLCEQILEFAAGWRQRLSLAGEDDSTAAEEKAGISSQGMDGFLRI